MENDESIETIDYTPFEEILFSKVREGYKHLHFLNIASQIDCAIIRSILSAAEIPTYTEGENSNGIYGGASSLLNNLFSIKLYILEEDYDEALLIVTDYIKNKANRLKENGDDKNYVKLLEILAAPHQISSKQELLGISIMPKKQNPENKSWWQKIFSK